MAKRKLVKQYGLNNDAIKSAQALAHRLSSMTLEELEQYKHGLNSELCGWGCCSKIKFGNLLTNYDIHVNFV